MKKLVKVLIARYPHLLRPIWAVIFPLFAKTSKWTGEEYESRASAFEQIYRENRWNDPESISGPGSTLEKTRTMQSTLTKAVKATKSKTLLDAPCGDFNWMKHIDLSPATHYIGGEIVNDLARDLQAQHGSRSRRFVQLDIASDPLPDSDLWLCRHVLFHLSNQDVVAVLRNFAQSSIGYLLADSFDFVRVNEHIQSGGFRFINLRIPPFNLPRPVARYVHSMPPAAPDYLGLWSREQVIAAIG